MASPTVERKIKTRKFHKKLFEIYCASIIKENIFVLKNVSVVVKLFGFCKFLSIFLELLPQDSWLGVRMRPNFARVQSASNCMHQLQGWTLAKAILTVFSKHFISITNMTDGQGEEERRDEGQTLLSVHALQQHHRPHLVDLSTFSDDFSKL